VCIATRNPPPLISEGARPPRRTRVTTPFIAPCSLRQGTAKKSQKKFQKNHLQTAIKKRKQHQKIGKWKAARAAPPKSLLAAAAESAAAPVANGEEAKGLGDMDVDEFLSMGLGDDDADAEGTDEEEEVWMSGRRRARVSLCGESAWYVRLLTIDGVPCREILRIQTTKAKWRSRRDTRRSTPPTVQMRMAPQLSAIRRTDTQGELCVRCRSTAATLQRQTLQGRTELGERGATGTEAVAEFDPGGRSGALTDEEEQPEGSLRSNNKMLQGEAATHKQELEALKKKVGATHATHELATRTCHRRSHSHQPRSRSRQTATTGELTTVAVAAAAGAHRTPSSSNT
jgi:hypothetical protein